jgi:ABC-2 type transport system permease protein
LRVFAQPPPGGAATYSDASVASVSTAINRLFASAKRYINPPVIKLDAGAKKESATPGPNVPALFFPSMLSMTILFVAQGLSGDVWNERNAKTLRRIVSTSVSLGQWLTGKLLATACVIALAGGAGLACARWLLGLPVSNPVLALFWIAAAGLTLYLFFVLLQMFAASERSAHMLVNFCFFPMAMMGGVFFPFEMMPAGMAAVARRTPVGWALAELRSLLAGPAPFASAFAILGAACLILFLLALWRLKRSFAR